MICNIVHSFFVYGFNSINYSISNQERVYPIIYKYRSV